VDRKARVEKEGWKYQGQKRLKYQGQKALEVPGTKALKYHVRRAAKYRRKEHRSLVSGFGTVRISVCEAVLIFAAVAGG
jgi:hypothetical protein